MGSSDSEQSGWLGQLSKETRELTAKEKAKLAADSEPVSEYRRTKLEREARLNWDKFYKRNRANFFKDRNWTKQEFSRLLPDVDFTTQLVILEAGCGVGNFILPFLDSVPSAFAYATDFSANAVQLLQEAPSYSSSRCRAFVADCASLSEDGGNPLRAEIPESSVDIATLIFVLSAVSPDKMHTVAANIREVLKPGGSVIVRDYGLNDFAMLRFEKGKRIQERFYARQDGTRAYYFPRGERSVIVRDYGLNDFAILRFEKGKRIQERFYARQDGTRAYYFPRGERSVIVRDYGLNDFAILRFEKGKRIQERFYARQDGTRAYYFPRGERSVIVRDYGLNDFAMLRFEKGKRIHERFYARQDGTRAYYISEG